MIGYLHCVVLYKSLEEPNITVCIPELPQGGIEILQMARVVILTPCSCSYLKKKKSYCLVLSHKFCFFFLIGMYFVFTVDFPSLVFGCAFNCSNESRVLMISKNLSKEEIVEVE